MAAIMTAWDGTARRAFRSIVVPGLVLLLGIGASFVLFKYVEQSVENAARLQFERQANDAGGIIEGRLHSYSDVLFALRALFATDDHIDRLRFHNFVEALDLNERYRGFRSINYAAYVPASEKQRFEEAVRRDTSL